MLQTFAALLLLSAAVPEPTPAPSGFVRVAEPVIYYEVAGSGEPVVLIHGGQMDRRMWDPQFESWSKKYRLVRYDVRGYGRSPTPTLPYSDTDDLLAVLDALAIPKAHLVGLSLGGRIAIDFTLAHPDRVASLVAVAAGMSGFEFSAGNWPQQMRAAQEQGGEAAAELWLKDPYMVPAMEHADLATENPASSSSTTRASGSRTRCCRSGWRRPPRSASPRSACRRSSSSETETCRTCRRSRTSSPPR